MEELVRLRKALVAHEQWLIPDQSGIGNGHVAEEAFLGTGQPGSYQSIHSQNLSARGFAYSGRISELGIEFAKSIWRPSELTPEANGFATWLKQNIAILNYEIGSRHMDNVAVDLTDRLRAMRFPSSVASVTTANKDDFRNFTRGILILGSNSYAKMNPHLDALREILTQLPTVIVQTAKIARYPDQLQSVGVVRHGEFPDPLKVACEMLADSMRKDTKA